MSAADRFNRWYLRAGYGEQHLYYRGYIAADRGSDSKDRKTSAQQEVERLAAAAFARYEQGHVALTQRKLAPGVYAYYATKLKNPGVRPSGRAFLRF
jgi:hypothetical protein